MINHVEPSNASRKLSKKYKDNWDDIFGKKSKPKKKKSKKKAVKKEDVPNPQWGDPTIRME